MTFQERYDRIVKLLPESMQPIGPNLGVLISAIVHQFCEEAENVEKRLQDLEEQLNLNKSTECKLCGSSMGLQTILWCGQVQKRWKCRNVTCGFVA